MMRELPAYSPLGPRALTAGAWAALTGGYEAERRVRALAAEGYAGAGFVTTDSGTAALALALRIARGARGDGVVALPGYACYDLVTAAAMADMRVVLYDVDPTTLAPDWDALRSVVAGRPVAAIVLVHLFGIPVDIAAAHAIARGAGAIVIEDAAQAVGTTIGGIAAGRHGALGVLSFGRGKGRTGGAGGALLVNDPALAPHVAAAERTLAAAPGGARPLVAATAQWVFGRPSLYGVPASLPGLHLGETIYHEPWAPAAMPRAALGMLAATWRAADAEAAARRARAASWDRVVDGLPHLRAVRSAVAGAHAGYLRYPVLGPASGPPVAPTLGLMRGYPMTLSDLPATAARLAAPAGTLRGSAEAAKLLFTLPTHSRLSAGAAARIAQHLAGSIHSGTPTP